MKERAVISELEAQRTALVDLLGSRAAEYVGMMSAMREAHEAEQVKIKGLEKEIDQLRADIKDLEAELSLYRIKPNG